MRGLSPSPTPRSASSLSSGLLPMTAERRPINARGPGPEIRRNGSRRSAHGAAVRLADSHEQRVKLIEQPGIGRQVRLEPRAGLFVTRRWPIRRWRASTRPHRRRRRTLAGPRIEEDCIAVSDRVRDLEQAPAQRPSGAVRIRSKLPLERSTSQRVSDWSRRLHAVGAAGGSRVPDRRRRGGYPGGRQQPAGTERCDRVGGIDPRGVLGKHGATATS